MTSRSSTTLGELKLPVKFRSEENDSVNRKMAKYASDAGSNWFMFASAWNAVAYRLIAAHKSCEKFDKLIVATPQTIALRFDQDHEMFDFFTAALSCLECAFTATFACASQAAPAVFPINADNDLKIMPTMICKRLKSEFADSSLVSSMVGILRAPRYKQLADFRNYLSHRGTLPRKQYASTGSSTPDPASEVSGNPQSLAWKWIYDFKIESGCFNPFVEFTDEAVKNLICGLDEFTALTLK
jgi:hypothetical protein